MALEARRWDISPRDAAEHVAGEPFPLDVIADWLPEIADADALATVHRGLGRWRALTPKEKERQGCPFERRAVEWYDTLRDEVAGEPDARAGGVDDSDVDAVIANFGDEDLLTDG